MMNGGISTEPPGGQMKRIDEPFDGVMKSCWRGFGVLGALLLLLLLLLFLVGGPGRLRCLHPCNIKGGGLSGL